MDMADGATLAVANRSGCLFEELGRLEAKVLSEKKKVEPGDERIQRKRKRRVASEQLFRCGVCIFL